MRDLTKEERVALESLLTLKPINHGGYYCFSRNKKKFKRSRVLMQLYLNKKLEIWEIVHHKDRNKTNDLIDNLEVMDISEHNSLHHAGIRRKRNI